jgi:hypothetical protein
MAVLLLICIVVSCGLLFRSNHRLLTKPAAGKIPSTQMPAALGTYVKYVDIADTESKSKFEVFLDTINGNQICRYHNIDFSSLLIYFHDEVLY